MKRWCISRMVETEPGNWEPKISQYAKAWRALSVDGAPWALVHFSINDLKPVLSDNQIKLLPDATLDAAWSSLPTSVRNAAKSAMEQAGFAWSVSNNWTVRQIINYAGGQLQPGTDFTAGDVHDR